MKKIKFIVFPIFGLASALLVNYTLPLIQPLVALLPVLQPTYFYIVTLLPGIIFGIFIALALLVINREKNTVGQTIVWLVICAAAYHASFWVLIIRDIVGTPFALLISGLIGGLIMLLGLSSLVKISKNSIIFLSILAGLIAFVWILAEYNMNYVEDPIFQYDIDSFLEDKMGGFERAFSYLYIWWNTLMSLGIVLAIKNKNEMLKK